MREITLLLCLASLATAQDRPNLLPNGGFEGTPTRFESKADEKSMVRGTIADGWHENSRGWASVDADYEQRTDGAHGGAAYQRIVAKAVRDGRVQIMSGAISLAADRVYEADMWLRSATGTGCSVLLRLPGAPYTSLAETAFGGAGEWTRVHFRHSSREAREAVLMVIFDGPGTIDMDDAVVRVAAERSDAPAQPGNLAPLGRLGVGVPSGWHVSGAGYTWGWEPKAGPFGVGAAKLVLGPNARLTLETMPRYLRYGIEHATGLSVRSEPAGARVSIGLRSSDDGRGFSGQIEATKEWQRLGAHGPAALSADERHYLQINVSGNNQTVWLDGLALREGAAAPFEPELGVSVTPTAGWGVYSAAEAVSADAKVVGAPAGSRLALHVTHVDGREADLQAVALGGSGLDQAKVTLTGDLAKSYGLLRLTARVVDGKGQALSAPAETLLAHVPPQAAGERANSPFGVHVTLRDPDLTAVSKLGFKWCRLHDASILTKWALVEPRPGEWTWYGAEMKLARQRGLKILGMLCSSPPWASGHEGETGYFSIYYPPKDLGQWREYVKRTVTQYKPFIDRWEVWNEPWGNSADQGFFRGGTPEQYAELLKAAYQEAKKADPKCTVLGIDTYDGKWDQAVLAAGAYGSYDVLSFHRYDSSLAGGPGDVFARKAEELKATQSKYGDPRGIENSEGGPGTTSKGSFFSFANSEYDGDWSFYADQVPRYYLGCLAAGISRFYLYSLHNAGRFAQPGNWMLTEPQFLCKPLTLSVSALASFTEGARWKRRLAPVAGASAHWFEQPEARWYGPAGSIVVVAIADGAQPVKLAKALPAGVKCFDRWGNPTPPPTSVGRAPVYVVATPAQAGALQSALTP
ncbi:MAG: hypothetical protein HZB16_17755 [Armatimonadetes bacterium]|nr:hypothetical protein [Armatimonadota bacterium]